MLTNAPTKKDQQITRNENKTVMIEKATSSILLDGDDEPGPPANISSL